MHGLLSVNIWQRIIVGIRHSKDMSQIFVIELFLFLNPFYDGNMGGKPGRFHGLPLRDIELLHNGKGRHIYFSRGFTGASRKSHGFA